jgi:hypothetical protein
MRGSILFAFVSTLEHFWLRYGGCTSRRCAYTYPNLSVSLASARKDRKDRKAAQEVKTESRELQGRRKETRQDTKRKSIGYWLPCEHARTAPVATSHKRRRQSPAPPEASSSCPPLESGSWNLSTRTVPVCPWDIKSGEGAKEKEKR